MEGSKMRDSSGEEESDGNCDDITSYNSSNYYSYV